MKKIAVFVLVATLMCLTLEAGAGECTLGAKDCRKLRPKDTYGYWWYCESCGDQTCWVFKGIKCQIKSELETAAETLLATVLEEDLCLVEQTAIELKEDMK